MKPRFLKTVIPFFLLPAGVLLSGCASSPDRTKQPFSAPAVSGGEAGGDPFSGLPERYRLRAREHEARGDLPKALRAWEVVHGFLPGDAEAGRKIPQLKERIPAAADNHFRKGLAFFKSHSMASARKEFLSALYLKPDHAEAIHYLKERLAGDDSLTYEVRKGDTLKEVSRKIYGDPQKDFLIAYFNGLKIDRPIEPHRTLKTPVLASFPTKGAPASAKSTAEHNPARTFDIQEALAKAQGAYGEGNYQESAALAEKVLESDPGNREVAELKNASYYALGAQLGEEKKYQEARKAFERVDPGYKDASALLSRNKMEDAEAHYLNGVKFFVEEKIEMAIQEWEAALSLEPKHPKARTDIETARSLLQKLEKIK